jgi:hypothetical protein
MEMESPRVDIPTSKSLFLDIIGEIVLLSEENDTSFRDWS